MEMNELIAHVSHILGVTPKEIFSTFQSRNFETILVCSLNVANRSHKSPACDIYSTSSTAAVAWKGKMLKIGVK